jgi:hypothetical protein
MNDHVPLVAQKTLSAFSLRWSCHSFSHIGATTVVPWRKFTSYLDKNHFRNASFIPISTLSI